MSQELPPEIFEYINLIFDTVTEINSSLAKVVPKDPDLRPLLMIITLGKYLKERFDDELMENLSKVANINKQKNDKGDYLL